MTTIQNVLDTISDLIVELREADWDFDYHCRQLRTTVGDFDKEYHEREADLAWDRRFDAQIALRKHGIHLNDAEKRAIDKRREEREASK